MKSVRSQKKTQIHESGTLGGLTKIQNRSNKLQPRKSSEQTDSSNVYQLTKEIKLS